jgi:hypothetical protein
MRPCFLVAEVRSKLAKFLFVREAADDDSDPPLASVKLAGDEFMLLDRARLPLVTPRPADRRAVADIAANLDTLARAAPADLESGAGPHV